jgi:GntR family transcriptional regulator
MRLWVSKSSEVPIRLQLEAQIILGILSNDLKGGQRLPSTRELARRHKIHPNTVSSVYRQLAANDWVESQRGSGVYVRTRGTDGPLDGNLPLDRLISFFLTIGLDKGQSLTQILRFARFRVNLRPFSAGLCLDQLAMRSGKIGAINKGIVMRILERRLRECV